MTVGLSVAEAQAYIDKLTHEDEKSATVIACINSPKNVTLSGPQAQLDVLQAILDKKSLFARKLKVGVAYHSPYMNNVAKEYHSLIENIDPGLPIGGRITMISSVTGQIIDLTDLTKADYWVQNMVSTVKFADAVSKIILQTRNRPKKLGARRSLVTVDILLELGPHSTMQGPLRDILTGMKNTAIPYISALARHTSALTTSLEMAGRLYCLGCSLNVGAIQVADENGVGSQHVLPDLPEYPFNHAQSYWHESRLSREFRFRKHPRNLLLGTTVPDWNPLEARWRNIIKASENPWIEYHKVSEKLSSNVLFLISKDEWLLSLSRSRHDRDGSRGCKTNGQARVLSPRILS